MSHALEEFATSLKHADRLIEGTKTGAGKPTAQETSMFVASVALTYAAWEAYVEDVAVEVAGFLADNISASQVPASAQSGIESDKPTAWALAVHPGWRELWKDRVTVNAKGDAGATKYGMNTAGPKQIRSLFSVVGLEFPMSSDDEKNLSDLIEARGTVVHTASTPSAFKKGKAVQYRDLIKRLTEVADDSLRKQCEALVGQSPWAAS